VLRHKAHGCFQTCFLIRPWFLQSLNVIHQGSFLHCISKPDLSDYLIVVQGQSNTSASWTITLSNSDVSDQECSCVSHVVEDLTVNVLRDV
ncbi:hypothetical protein XENOCAPTIV_012943, partial [Xenoophorus captivus]